jgi:putative flippase GtrA
MKIRILEKYSILEEIIKFGLIGSLNFLVDFSIYFILTRKLFIYYILANVIAFLMANSMSFILNKKIAFQDQDNDRIFLKYIKFLGFTIFSLLISIIVLFISVHYFKINDIYGKILGTILAAIWNFLTYKKLVFKTKDSSNMI